MESKGLGGWNPWWSVCSCGREGRPCGTEAGRRRVLEGRCEARRVMEQGGTAGPHAELTGDEPS